MPHSQSNQTRRRVLRGASLALFGSIAGCTNILGNNTGRGESDDSSNQSPDATPTTDGNSNDDSNGGSITPAPPNGEFPYMQATTGTTDYGVSLDNKPVMGSNNTPIDMYYWSDYLCLYCSRFALQIHPKLGHKEIADGILRVIFLELPNIGENSFPAAVLSKSVWHQVADSDPNLFWKWHHEVFEQRETAGSGWADIEKLLAITEDTGIDTDPIRNRIRNKQDSIKAEIDADVQAANKEQIQATPAFVFVNRTTGAKKKVIGMQPDTVYKTAIQTVKNS